MRGPEDISYLVLFDAGGKVLAASGWDPARLLSRPDSALTDPAVVAKRRLDAEVMIGEPDKPRASLRFGLSTAFIQHARRELVQDNLAIGAMALLLSLASMIALSYWLTRNLTRLTDAAESLAGGNLNVRLPNPKLRAPHILSLGFPKGMAPDLPKKLAAENVHAAPRLGRLRLSPHVYNDEQDVERFVEVFRRVAT